MPKKPIVTILKGLPGSGKSTFAKEQVVSSGGSVKRVNKDDLRAMLDIGEWSQSNERFILLIRDRIIMDAIRKGCDVIVDDTNLNPKMERGIRKLVGDRATIKVIFFNTTADECVARDAKRTGTAHVGEKVIRDMAKQWGKWQHEDCTTVESQFPLIGQDPNLPHAIIVDVDGTLARNASGRSPYDWHRVGEDELIEEVGNLVVDLENGREIIIFSGRDAACQKETEEWLLKHGVPFDHFFMRAEGDQRKDSIVKSELFDNHVAGKFYIDLVIDDRKQVKEMWVERGLFVLDVNQHDEIF